MNVVLNRHVIYIAEEVFMINKVKVGFSYALIIVSIAIIVKLILMRLNISSFLNLWTLRSFFNVSNFIIYSGLVLLYISMHAPKPKKHAIIIFIALVVLQTYPILLKYLFIENMNLFYFIGVTISSCSIIIILWGLFAIKKFKPITSLHIGYITYYISSLCIGIIIAIVYIFNLELYNNSYVIIAWVTIIPRIIIFFTMIIYAIINIKMVNGLPKFIEFGHNMEYEE